MSDKQATVQLRDRLSSVRFCNTRLKITQKAHSCIAWTQILPPVVSIVPQIMFPCSCFLEHASSFISFEQTVASCIYLH